MLLDMATAGLSGWFTYHVGFEEEFDGEGKGETRRGPGVRQSKEGLLVLLS